MFLILQTDIFGPFLKHSLVITVFDQNFGMCIKDPINKTCWNNGKDPSNGVPKIKLKLKLYQKKNLPKIFASHGWIWKFSYATFKILGPLECQGWVVIPQNVKKSQNHCTLLYMLCEHTGIHCGMYSICIGHLYVQITSRGLQPYTHRLNVEFDLQILFGLLCTAVLIGWDPATPPPLPPPLGPWAHIRGRYWSATTTSLCSVHRIKSTVQASNTNYFTY
jgi:hypothetical protein